MKAKFVGKKITEGLTADQISQFLNILFELWDDQNTEKLLSNLNKDIASTVSQIFFPETSGNENIVSDEKYVEKWKNIWDEWFDIVNNVGDEEGKYVSKNISRDCFYFNNCELADDLDKIASRMLCLLERVYAIGRESDGIFEEAIEEIEDNLRRYPGWIEIYPGDCYIGNILTHCMLKWKWLAADSPVSFLNSTVQIENSLRIIKTEYRELIDFFLKLPEKARKQIYEYLKLNRDTSVWNEELDSVQSKWHQIYHAFSEEFCPEIYLENCKRLLHENWRYGLPIIEDLLKKNNETEAEKIYEQTLVSYVKQIACKEWQFQTDLLVSVIQSENPFRSQTPASSSRFQVQAEREEISEDWQSDDDIVRLLKGWSEIAEKLGMSEKAAVLRLQYITWQCPYDWDKVLKIIRQSETSFRFQAETCERSAISALIDQWRTFVILASLNFSFCSQAEAWEREDSWIKWLLDAAMDETKGKSWFCEKMEKWLTSLADDPNEFHARQEQIHLLTCDLTEIAGMKNQYPAILELVQTCVIQKKEKDISRHNWLRKMEGDKYAAVLMTCWEKNALKMLPDPADTSGSNYDLHVLWLKVVRELDPKAYDLILVQWKTKHKRRRNLWKTMQEKGLSVQWN